MVEKYGKFPANARVDVDYSKGKPIIKFDYPKVKDSPKKQAIKQNAFGIHSIILLVIAACFIYYPHLINGSGMTISYPEECNVSMERYNINTSSYSEDNIKNIEEKYKTGIKGANFTCDNETYMVRFTNGDMNGYGSFPGFYNSDIHTRELLEILLRFSILPIISFFIANKYLTKYLVKQKWYQKWYPKHQGKCGSKKYIKFKPKDVENNMVEIPLFGNVVLDYKARGEFSDKLIGIKIREHQYYKYKQGKVGKKKVELYKWYARFYFKDKPKTGNLEVIFR